MSRLPSLIFQCLRKSCTPEADTASCCTLEPPDLNGASVVFGSHSDRKRRGRISGPTPIRLRCVCFFVWKANGISYIFCWIEKIGIYFRFWTWKSRFKIADLFCRQDFLTAVLSIHRHPGSPPGNLWNAGFNPVFDLVAPVPWPFE